MLKLGAEIPKKEPYSEWDQDLLWDWDYLPNEIPAPGVSFDQLLAQTSLARAGGGKLMRCGARLP